MKHALTILFVIFVSGAYAQNAPKAIAGNVAAKPHENTAGVYESPEKPAYFPQGKDSLDRFISRNLRLAHVENSVGATGKAIVVFIVEKDGSIGIAEILRTSGDKDFDTESVRIARAMPKWVPAKDKGEAVRSSNMLTFAYHIK